MLPSLQGGWEMLWTEPEGPHFCIGLKKKSKTSVSWFYAWHRPSSLLPCMPVSCCPVTVGVRNLACGEVQPVSFRDLECFLVGERNPCSDQEVEKGQSVGQSRMESTGILLSLPHLLRRPSEWQSWDRADLGSGLLSDTPAEEVVQGADM